MSHARSTEGSVPWAAGRRPQLLWSSQAVSTVDELGDPAVDRDPPWATSEILTFEEAYSPLLEHAYYVGLRFFGRDHQMADEVAQETLTRAYERWSKVSRHPKPVAWTVDAAWKVSLELERKRGRNVPYHVIQEPAVAEDRVLMHPLLTDALRKLTARQRTVVMLRHYFGYDVRQAAELLGVSESKVKTATNEATTKLRRLLKAETEGTE